MIFKEEAKRHQKNFFHNHERQDPDDLSRGRAQKHWLNESAAATGKNFYNKKVFTAVNQYRDGKINVPEWFLDTLRSQHIPFNFFVPLWDDQEFAIKVLKQLFRINITSLTRIEFEFPSRSDNPLEDNTSFDAFIEFETGVGKGFFGIETKYTEGGYSAGDQEKAYFENDDESVYYMNTHPDFFLDARNQLLKENSYRQIWRNHLLSLKFAQDNAYEKFISVTMYPHGNNHFFKHLPIYKNFLTKKGQETLEGITYEKYFRILLENAVTDKQRNWIIYLIARYLVILNGEQKN
jgi:hypothetical protein